MYRLLIILLPMLAYGEDIKEQKKDILKEIDKRTKATITVSTEKTENTISASSEDSKPSPPECPILRRSAATTLP